MPLSFLKGNDMSMTYYTRMEKQSYKIVDWDDLQLGEYFWASDIGNLCIKVTPENFLDVETKAYYHIDDIELSCCCEVFARVTWQRVYEEDK